MPKAKLSVKHVHFAESPVTRVYSPPPSPSTSTSHLDEPSRVRTPSPTWSSDEVDESEDGLGTPPSPFGVHQLHPAAHKQAAYQQQQAHQYQYQYQKGQPFLQPPQPQRPQHHHRDQQSVKVASSLAHPAQAQAISLNPLLTIPVNTKRSSYAPAIKEVTSLGGSRFDVSLSLSSLSLLSASLTPLAIPSSTLNQPATHPPLPALTIHMPHIPYWKPVHVVSKAPPSSSGQGTAVTVADILETLKRYLNNSVTANEFAWFHPDLQKAVSKSFRWRCQRVGQLHAQQGSVKVKEAEDAELAKGLKRVDCLRGNTMWIGLVPTTADGSSWSLQLAAPPAPASPAPSTSSLESSRRR